MPNEQDDAQHRRRWTGGGPGGRRYGQQFELEGAVRSRKLASLQLIIG